MHTHTNVPTRLAVGHSKSTPHQRLYIRTLLTQLDLDVDYMTPAHRRYFDTANLPQPEPNERIDAVLCEFTRAQASAFIQSLLEEVPHDSQ